MFSEQLVNDAGRFVSLAVVIPLNRLYLHWIQNEVYSLSRRKSQQYKAYTGGSLSTGHREKLVRYYVWTLLYILRDLDTKKVGADVFGEIQNVALEENGEDKIVKENN